MGMKSEIIYAFVVPAMIVLVPTLSFIIWWVWRYNLLNFVNDVWDEMKRAGNIIFYAILDCALGEHEIVDREDEEV